jgi:hypothetical protein
MTQSDACFSAVRGTPAFPTAICNHTFPATGITAYLDNGGSLENAQVMAAHEREFIRAFPRGTPGESRYT